MSGENWSVLIAVLLTFAAIFAFVGAQPYFEMQSYNRLTGSHATYWDAVWIELRVQGCSDEKS